MKYILLTTILAAAPAWAAESPASAPAAATDVVAAAPVNTDTFAYECKRYRSRCKGNACIELEPKLQEDTERKLMTVVTTENVTYDIHPNQAMEIAFGAGNPIAAGDTIPASATKTFYEFVTVMPPLIKLENKVSSGNVRERVTINVDTGFYSYYVIHTDGSIAELPVGTPYFAYFGWCNKPGEALPVLQKKIPVATPTAEKPVETSPAPAAASKPALP